jgi:hypothetical protein
MASERPKEITLDDGEKYLQQLVTIFDPDTIDDIASGHKRELSLGYTLDHDTTPGEWNGQPYDVRQKNIRYNHLSVVKKARGGSLCRFNIDGQDVNVDGVCYDKVLNFNTIEREDMIFNKDGKEYEVKDDVHALLNALEEEKKVATDSVESLEKALEEKVSEADSLKAKLDVLESQEAKDSQAEEFKKAVSARVKLEKESAEILGDVALDGLTDREIKEKVVAKSSKVSLDGKSEAYVDAAYDMIVTDSVASSAELGNVVHGNNATDSDDIVEAARKKARETALNQWKAK